MDHCYRDNFKPFPHTRGVILSHIFSTRFQKGSDHNAVNTWTFMVMERNRYYRTCKCHSSYCSVQTAQRRIQNWDCMHYSYRNYTDWYYCYDSMLSGSDAHISNRHCRLFFIVTVSLVHCWRRWWWWRGRRVLFEVLSIVQYVEMTVMIYGV